MTTLNTIIEEENTPETKADWLRSEIEKLEMVVEALTEKYYGIGYTTDTCIECSNHDRIKKALEALTTIITRYKEELKVLESKV